MYIIGFNFCDNYHPYVTHPKALVKVTCGQIKRVAFIKASKGVKLFKIFSWKQNYLNLYHNQTTWTWHKTNTSAVQQAIKNWMKIQNCHLKTDKKLTECNLIISITTLWNAMLTYSKELEERSHKCLFCYKFICL